MHRIVLVLLMLAWDTMAQAQSVTLLPDLNAYVKSRLDELAAIPPDRRERLDGLADFIRTQTAAGQPVRLVFICTHNSRRSQMAQLWAALAAAQYGIDSVEVYSGGTEVTAFNPRAIASLRRAGWMVTSSDTPRDNPVYSCSYSSSRPGLRCFSKLHNQPPNPASGFAAIMTCSQADENCPHVPGAALRLSLPYNDPKAADDTPEEAAVYDDRCCQIAAEMLFVFSRVAEIP